MKYFVVADPHGFYTELMTALNEKGFDSNDPNHKLIVCGDLMDRGKEALKMESFIIDLIDKEKVILIRGNHEDLMLDMLSRYAYYCEPILNTSMYGFGCHHYTNGTFDTALQLTGFDLQKATHYPSDFVSAAYATPFLSRIIGKMVNYYETDNYIFVHGWIPSTPIDTGRREFDYTYDANWRSADDAQWSAARWLNGIKLAHRYKVYEKNKTIVCGHFHCSYGWAYYKVDRKEFPPKDHPDFKHSFEPYYDKGIIAIDACTAYSGIVNCLVIED